MTKRSSIYLLLTIAIFTAPAVRADETRNCPFISDQVINVEVGHATIFQLTIQNPVGSTISIYQYPLGGALQQSGPTPLDFVFLPGKEFNGFSVFTYRIQPPFGCPEDRTLGKVSFMGGQAAGTTTGITIDPNTGVAPVNPLAELCGLGMTPLFMSAGAAWMIVLCSRRRAQ